MINEYSLYFSANDSIRVTGMITLLIIKLFMLYYSPTPTSLSLL